VRQRCGRWLSPLSSTKTIVRPSFWAFFFDGGPGLALPLDDGLFVPLQRPPLRPLRAPVQLAEQLPDMAGMIADAELALDQIRYPWAGPEWRFIAEFLRAFQQPIHQMLTLPGIQHGQPARPSGCF
jgi:hypothetical protein